MHYRADYVTRLTELGAPVAADRVVSAPRATALYLQEHHPEVRRVLAVGASGLDRELRDVGIEVVNAGFAAERMAERGHRRRRRGGRAAGRRRRRRSAADVHAHRRRGRLHPCRRAVHRHQPRPGLSRWSAGSGPAPGSIVAAIEVASGQAPIVIGKPEPLLMEEAAHAVGRDAKDAIVIGDGIVTDLAAANAVGARTILMLTGVTTGAALEALPSADQPFKVAANAEELDQILRGLD